MNKKELFIKTPSDNNIDDIYKIKTYSSLFDADDYLKTYNETPIGVSKDAMSTEDNNESTINPTELYAYDDIEEIKSLRSGYNKSGKVLFKYGLDELYLISTALKNNIEKRIGLYKSSEYFNKLNDWKNAFNVVQDSTSSKTGSISNGISYLYLCQAPTEIFCTIRGVELKYTQYYDNILDIYFYILPPDIFKYTDLFDSIDSVRYKHIYHKNDSSVYPCISYFENTSEDITTELTTQINNMNLIK